MQRVTILLELIFTDGQYKNFTESQIIAENIVMIPAYGHTTGNSLL